MIIYNIQYQKLWIYREGEGLLYYKQRAMGPGISTTDVNRPLHLNGSPSVKGNHQSTRNNGNGHFDEARLYNDILTPRNIRYLYENPTGRVHELRPRPGLAVKAGYDGFFTPNTTYQNIHAYIHGYDVDGNPADVSGFVFKKVLFSQRK